MLRSSRILNPSLLAALASAGHGQTIIVADAGLPIPRGVPVLDLSITPGHPTFTEVTRIILDAGAFEGYVIASESSTSAPVRDLAPELAGLAPTIVDHEEFKRRVPDAHLVVRTGEFTPFANIGLVAGTTF